MYFFLVMALPGGTTKGQERSAELVALPGTPAAMRFSSRLQGKVRASRVYTEVVDKIPRGTVGSPVTSVNG